MIDMIAHAIRANRSAVRGLTFVLDFPNFGILVTGVSPLLEGLRPSSQVAVGERPGNRSKRISPCQGKIDEVSLRIGLGQPHGTPMRQGEGRGNEK